ncbi:glycosyltransferase family 4 protein [Lysinibacillus sp. FSL H8-0500]|uniref:glycosyltransferase family 4 protein n=1 Tax=Lysinibacillus sp. FSL H8-0500 TaxID=2921393 RepID=UPI0031011998
MKICHLTSVHQVDDTRIFIKECSSLAEFGHEVYLVAPNTVNTRKNNVTIIGIQRENKGRINRIIDTTKKVYEQALLIDADIYHFHDPELIPVGIKLSKKGKKVIYDVHEDVPRDILSKDWIPKIFRKFISFIFEQYEKRVARKFNAIVTATPFINERFKKINTNTYNINNYPLLDELVSVGNLVSTEKEYIGYVGGLSSIRGINEIVEAAQDILCKVAFVGPLDEQLKQKVANSKNVEYFGVLNREEVRDFLAKCSAGLVTFLPEPNHINAQPNKMFEYMSAGIPVISSNFPLWKNIIESNNCGICVDPTNPDEIAEAINWIYNNPDEANNMGKNGRSAVEQKYNWKVEEKKLINLYQKLSQ